MTTLRSGLPIQALDGENSRKTVVVAALVACFLVPAPASAAVRLLQANPLEQVVVKYGALVVERLALGQLDQALKRYWPGGRYRSWTAGENLDWRSPAPMAAQVVRAWLNSPPHRRNLLNRGWRSVGVGAVTTLAPFCAYASLGNATIVSTEFGRCSGRL